MTDEVVEGLRAIFARENLIGRCVGERTSRHYPAGASGRKAREPVFDADDRPIAELGPRLGVVDGAIAAHDVRRKSRDRGRRVRFHQAIQRFRDIGDQADERRPARICRGDRRPPL